MPSPLTIGYIGLGLMGKSIARNILKAGFPLVVHNRSRGAVDELVAEGAAEAFSPAEVARQVDVVFTNLPDTPDVEQAALGEGGVIEAARPGLIFVDNSTIKPASARAIAEALGEKGVLCLDAPVSGGDIGARKGTLSIMVGGPAEALERVLPVFQAMGKTITHVGESGAGQIAKAANQIMVAAQMVAMGELLIFAKKAGADPHQGGRGHPRRGGAVLDAGRQAAAPVRRQPQSRLQGSHAGQGPGHRHGDRPRVRRAPALCRRRRPALQRPAPDGHGRSG